MLTLSTASLKGYGLNRVFQFAKKAGYDAIDLDIINNQYDTHNAEYINELIEAHDIKVHSVSAPRNTTIKKIEELTKFTKEIGAKVLIIQPPKILDFKTTNWIQNEIPKIREKENISIALENAPAGTILGIFSKHAISNNQDLKKFKHVSLDTARVGEKKQDLIRVYTALKKYLVHINLSNIKNGKKYSLPQEGILPIESLLTKLKTDKFPGAISVKIHPHNMHAGKDEKMLEELKNIKKFYEKYYVNAEA